MQHRYIYYKLAREELATAIEHASELISLVANATGVRGRLMERVDQGASITLMEIYPDISDAAVFDAALSSALSRDTPARAAMRNQERRVETFRDVPLESTTCA